MTADDLSGATCGPRDKAADDQDEERDRVPEALPRRKRRRESIHNWLKRSLVQQTVLVERAPEMDGSFDVVAHLLGVPTAGPKLVVKKRRHDERRHDEGRDEHNGAAPISVQHYATSRRRCFTATAIESTPMATHITKMMAIRDSGPTMCRCTSTESPT